MTNKIIFLAGHLELDHRRIMDTPDVPSSAPFLFRQFYIDHEKWRLLMIIYGKNWFILAPYRFFPGPLMLNYRRYQDTSKVPSSAPFFFTKIKTWKITK